MKHIWKESTRKKMRKLMSLRSLRSQKIDARIGFCKDSCLVHGVRKTVDVLKTLDEKSDQSAIPLTKIFVVESEQKVEA